VLARPRPPTYLGFKEGYMEGDQRYGQERRGKGTVKGEKEQGVQMQQMGGRGDGYGNGNASAPAFEGMALRQQQQDALQR